MALALDPTLKTALEGDSRRPLVRVVSAQDASYIPLAGAYLWDTPDLDENPNVVLTASGRIAVVFIQGDTIIHLGVTDPERLEFTFFTVLTASGTSTFGDVCVVDLPSGELGIVYQETIPGTGHYIRWRSVNLQGELVASGTIATYASADTAKDPWVSWLPFTGVFMAVWVHLTGTTYSIQKSTSADFATWSAPAACSISGLTSTREIKYPSLVELSAVELFLWFDYVNVIINDQHISNIYYSVSTNGGTTWGAAVQVTTYTDVTARGQHPVAVTKGTDLMSMVYTEVRGVLFMNNTGTYSDPLWASCSPGSVGRLAYVRSFDPVNRILYVINDANLGIVSILMVDVDNWEVIRCVNESSVPTFDGWAWYSVLSVLSARQMRSNCHLVAVCRTSGGGPHWIHVYDGINNRIVQYNFSDSALYGYEKNVPDVPPQGPRFILIDGESMRMYVVSVDTYLWSPKFYLGYIDLTETEPPYSWHSIRADVYGSSMQYLMSSIGTGGMAEMTLIPDHGMIAVCGGYSSSALNYRGILYIIDIQSKGIVHMLYWSEVGDEFPRAGLRSLAYANGRLYGHFMYESGYGEAEKRGLFSVDVLTGQIQYHRPDFAELDNYGITEVAATEDGHIICGTVGYGVLVYDPEHDTWIRHSSESIQGMTIRGDDIFGTVIYDQASGIIFLGTTSGGSGAQGITALNRYGEIRRTYLIEGEKNGSWALAPATPFLQGLTDFHTVFALDPTDNSFFAFWVKQRFIDYGIKWDKEGDFDISPFLVNRVSILRRIDGRPAQLHFDVGRGHLFDPHNTFSLLSIYLEKGRSLSVYFGERYEGSDYWQIQGTFYVTALTVRYQEGRNPVANVTAEDFRTLWIDDQTLTTPAYTEEFADVVLNDILVARSALHPSKIVLPQFHERAQIDNQWIDTALSDIVEEICQRFFYFPRMDVENNFTVRRIAVSLPTDHIYPDSTRLVDFSPDDRYSDFTNRIIVEGEERALIDVIHEEESVDQFHGTVGWWNAKKRYQRWYSKDRQKRCTAPRLSVIESGGSLGVSLSGGLVERLYYVDEYSYVVTQNIPNAMTMLIMSATNMAASFLVPDAVVTFGFIGSGGMTIPIGSIVQGLSLFWLFTQLTAIANFQYEIFAKPIGQIRRRVQATENDYDMQSKLGAVITKKIEDAMIYSFSQAQYVARKEMELVQLERKRVSFQKVSHLQDEEGDTLEMVHPYTKAPMKLYVTDLERVYPIVTNRATGATGRGPVDKIQAWVIEP